MYILYILSFHKLSAAKSRLAKCERLEHLRQVAASRRAELKQRLKWKEAREKLRVEVEALEARAIIP